VVRNKLIRNAQIRTKEAGAALSHVVNGRFARLLRAKLVMTNLRLDSNRFLKRILDYYVKPAQYNFYVFFFSVIV